MELTFLGTGEAFDTITGEMESMMDFAIKEGVNLYFPEDGLRVTI